MEKKHHTLYRSRNGKIFGVFQGIADATDLSAYGLRLAAIVIMFFTGFFPVLIYIVAAILMKLEPITPLDSEGEEFYNSMTSNRRLAMERLLNRIDSLDRRTQRIETLVTSKGSDWDRRMGENV